MCWLPQATIDARYVVIAKARTSFQTMALDWSLRPQLILLDILLPTTEDGLDAVRRLASGNMRPIVVIGPQARLRRAALTAGAVGFVVQGDDADVVLAAICATTPGPPTTTS